MVYTIAWDMCTDELKAKLKAINDFETNIHDALNVLELLKEI